jgi:cytidine deaminase
MDKLICRHCKKELDNVLLCICSKVILIPYLTKKGELAFKSISNELNEQREYFICGECRKRLFENTQNNHLSVGTKKEKK